MRLYLLAASLSQLNRPDDAFMELDRRLDIPDGGFIATVTGSLPPESSPLLAPLRASLQWDDWYSRFDGRRAAMREEMIRMEADGELVKAP